MICLTAAPNRPSTSSTGCVPLVEAVAPAVAGVRCVSCQQAQACLVLAWPDTRFAVCTACVPPSMRAVAEPLDDDDELVAAAAMGPA